jgi:Leucine-rich repeat (LRR) protein
VAYEVTQLNSEVEALYLIHRGLDKIPDVVFQHKQLKFLLLSRNKLTTLPAAIGQLVNLQELYLLDNQLTSLPVEIGQLANLQYLDLRRNQNLLFSEVCIALSTYPKTIHIIVTKHAGSPDKGASFLRVAVNALTDLPPAIQQLSNLQSLNLSYNKLTTLPAEIGQLAKLQSLNLYKNQLTSLPAAIGQLDNLQELYLQGNENLSFSEVCTVLSAFPKTIRIIATNDYPHLYPNKDSSFLQVMVAELTDLPPAIQQMRNLKVLDLRYCAISPAHQAEIKRWLPRVKIRFRESG